jgi:hypothetical protein
MGAVTVAQAEMHIAQAKLQTATAKVQQIDQMVQYRLGIIAQMENRPAQAQISLVQQFPTGGISSEPAGSFQPAYSLDPDDRVNRVHATRDLAGDVRRAL